MAPDAGQVMESERVMTRIQILRNLKISGIRMEQDQRERVTGLICPSPRTRQEAVQPMETVPLGPGILVPEAMLILKSATVPECLTVLTSKVVKSSLKAIVVPTVVALR